MTDRKTILYAEDDPMVRGTYQRLFGKFFPENEVEPFHDGTSLESRLSGDLRNVALIVTDNDMPGKTGGQIIKEYARREEFRQIPFLLLYAGEPIIGRVAVENGAFAYADKLSGMENTIATVKRALEYSDSQPTAL